MSRGTDFHWHKMFMDRTEHVTDDERRNRGRQTIRAAWRWSCFTKYNKGADWSWYGNCIHNYSWRSEQALNLCKVPSVTNRRKDVFMKVGRWLIVLKTVRHPPYHRDLASCHFCLLLKLKKNFKSCRFVEEEFQEQSLWRRGISRAVALKKKNSKSSRFEEEMTWVMNTFNLDDIQRIFA